MLMEKSDLDAVLTNKTNQVLNQFQCLWVVRLQRQISPKRSLERFRIRIDSDLFPSLRISSQQQSQAAHTLDSFSENLIAAKVEIGRGDIHRQVVMLIQHLIEH